MDKKEEEEGTRHTQNHGTVLQIAPAIMGPPKGDPSVPSSLEAICFTVSYTEKYSPDPRVSRSAWSLKPVYRPRNPYRLTICRIASIVFTRGLLRSEGSLTASGDAMARLDTRTDVCTTFLASSNGQARGAVLNPARHPAAVNVAMDDRVGLLPGWS